MTFDLVGSLRRIRRLADMSQRELAAACGVSQSAVAHAENGTRDLPVGVLVRAAAAARLRLTLVDADGTEVPPMAANTVRDRGHRRFPAHLDAVHSEERPYRYADHPYRPELTYTFERDRSARDRIRRSSGTPDDHPVPQEGDSPAERRARRRRESLRRAHEERQRRFAAGELRSSWDFVCTCPPRCAELDLGERPVHVPDCPCGCDVD